VKSPTRIVLWLASLLTAIPAFAETPAPKTGKAKSADELYATGKALFDAYAPPEIKEQFAFPTREQWDDFAARLQKTRETGSMAELAAYEPEARLALAALRALPDYQEYADWLAERLDEIEIAKEAQKIPPVPPSVVLPKFDGSQPAPPPAVPAAPAIPLYDLWLGRLRNQPRPTRADEFLPEVKKAFAAEGVPTQLAWLAETESMFNPSARSPAGARGLFQLMPATARAQGLSLFPFDHRMDTEKSAHAAARLLHAMHDRFDSWPLALAAYNAGEGRVGRALKNSGAKTFAGIADSLSTETRLYVPRVLATLKVREGVEADALPAPTKPAKTD